MKTVLLVDDCLEYLDTMEINLPQGCRAVLASSLAEASAQVTAAPPDAAVLDVRLRADDEGNKDGLELLKWFHANLPGTPVIMISAFRDFGHEAEALALGAEYFLRKPIQPEEFREAVAKVLMKAKGTR